MDTLYKKKYLTYKIKYLERKLQIKQMGGDDENITDPSSKPINNQAVNTDNANANTQPTLVNSNNNAVTTVDIANAENKVNTADAAVDLANGKLIEAKELGNENEILITSVYFDNAKKVAHDASTELKQLMQLRKSQELITNANNNPDTVAQSKTDGFGTVSQSDALEQPNEKVRQSNINQSNALDQIDLIAQPKTGRSDKVQSNTNLIAPSQRNNNERPMPKHVSPTDVPNQSNTNLIAPNLNLTEAPSQGNNEQVIPKHVSPTEVPNQTNNNEQPVPTIPKQHVSPTEVPNQTNNNEQPVPTIPKQHVSPTEVPNQNKSASTSIEELDSLKQTISLLKQELKNLKSNFYEHYHDMPTTGARVYEKSHPYFKKN